MTKVVMNNEHFLLNMQDPESKTKVIAVNGKYYVPYDTISIKQVKDVLYIQFGNEGNEFPDAYMAQPDVNLKRGDTVSVTCLEGRYKINIGDSDK